MKVIIIGDSLVFPRASEKQLVSDSWPMLLNSRLPQASVVWQRAIPTLMMPQAVREVRLVQPYFGANRSFDVLVVQIGVVDSCLRPWPKAFEKVIDRLPQSRKVQKWLNSKYRFFLRFYAKPWVSQEKYVQAVHDMIAAARPFCGRVIFIKTAPALPALSHKVPGINDSIDRFNAGLQAAVNAHGPAVAIALDPYREKDRIRDLILPDGMHLTVAGHAAVADAVQAALAEPAKA